MFSVDAPIRAYCQKRLSGLMRAFVARGPLTMRHSSPVLQCRGNRPFRAKSGALILKIHVDQELAQSLIAQKLPNGRALLQAALRTATARFCKECTTTTKGGHHASVACE